MLGLTGHVVTAALLLDVEPTLGTGLGSESLDCRDRLFVFFLLGLVAAVFAMRSMAL